MTYENKYDCNMSPPAPTIKCSISSPADRLETEPVSVTGLLDSGAAITCVPLEIVKELGLRPVDQKEIKAYDGRSEKQYVYSAVIYLPTHESLITKVIGVKLNHALIGRDILNRWKLILNGPQKQLIVE